MKRKSISWFGTWARPWLVLMPITHFPINRDFRRSLVGEFSTQQVEDYSAGLSDDIQRRIEDHKLWRVAAGYALSVNSAPTVVFHCTHRNAGRKELPIGDKDYQERPDGSIVTAHFCRDCGQQVYRVHPRPVPRAFLGTWREDR